MIIRTDLITQTSKDHQPRIKRSPTADNTMSSGRHPDGDVVHGADPDPAYRDIPLITHSLRSVDDLVSDVLHGLSAPGRVELFHGSTPEGSDSPAHAAHRALTQRHAPQVRHSSRNSRGTDDPPDRSAAVVRRDRSRGCARHARRCTHGIVLAVDVLAVDGLAFDAHTVNGHTVNGLAVEARADHRHRRHRGPAIRRDAGRAAQPVH